MSGWLLFVFSLVLAVISIAAIVWAVIRWKKSSSRNTGCGFAFLFFILATICGVASVVKFIEFAKENKPDSDALEKSLDNFTNFVSGKYADSPFMDSLKSMQPENIEIPTTYFTYPGFRDYYRMPVIYPYSISTIDNLIYGTLNDESGIKFIAKDANRSKPLLGNILEFSFDKNTMIGKTGNDSLPYFIFHFKNGKTERFQHENNLKTSASHLGFDTIKPMTTVREYYIQF